MEEVQIEKKDIVISSIWTIVLLIALLSMSFILCYDFNPKYISNDYRIIAILALNITAVNSLMYLLLCLKVYIQLKKHIQKGFVSLAKFQIRFFLISILPLLAYTLLMANKNHILFPIIGIFFFLLLYCFKKIFLYTKDIRTLFYFKDRYTAVRFLLYNAKLF